MSPPRCRPRRLALKAELQELADLRALQVAAGKTLERACRRADARTALSQAISDRTELPRGSPKTPRRCAAFWKVPTRWKPLPPGLCPG
jgi:hypothetical protein